MIVKKILGGLMIFVGILLALIALMGAVSTLFKVEANTAYELGYIGGTLIATFLICALCFFLIRTGTKWMKKS